MKKILTVVALAVAVSSPRLMFAAMNITTDGSLEVSGVSANNEVDLKDGTNDHRGTTATRVRVGVNAQVTEGVTGRVELTRTPASAFSASLYGGGAKPSSVSNEEGYWRFDNANVTLADIWGLKAVLGRQYVGEAGDLVWHVGPKSDDNLSITSTDGLLLQSRKWDMLSIDLFTGKASTPKISPSQTDATASGDVNVNNIQVAINNVLPDGKIGVGLLMADDANTKVAGDNNHLRIARVGVKGGVQENMVTYRAEYLQNFGQFNGAGLSAAGDDLKYKGNAIDLGAGLNLKKILAGDWGFAVNYTQGSGDKSANNDDKSFHDLSVFGLTSDRYFGEIFGKSEALNGGFKPLGMGLDTGVTQNRGLGVVNLCAKYVPEMWDGKYSAQLDYFMFSRSAKAAGEKSDLGNEVDLTLGYAQSSNVTLEGGYAALMPGKGLSEAKLGADSPKDTVSKLFARINIKWGGEEK